MALACDIPVFRFALDRWNGDLYQLHVAPQRLLDFKKRIPDSANAEVVADEKLVGDAAELWFPTLPNGAVSKSVAWSEAIDEKTLPILLNSPIRTEIVQRLCRGDSGVWVLLEGKDTAANDGAARLISVALRGVEKTAKLPVMTWNDPASAPGPGPELRIGFTMLRLDPADAAESATAAMLVDPANHGAADPTQPTALLIFGRGHVLVSLRKEQLAAANIQSASRFLLGACSCEVKEEHPGWDLLMDADWDARLQLIDEQRKATTTEPAVRPNVTLKPESIEIHGSTSAPASTEILTPQPVWPKVGGVALALAAIAGIWLLFTRSKNTTR